jgi:hypothetical protein
MNQLLTRSRYHAFRDSLQKFSSVLPVDDSTASARGSSCQGRPGQYNQMTVKQFPRLTSGFIPALIVPGAEETYTSSPPRQLVTLRQGRQQQHQQQQQDRAAVAQNSHGPQKRIPPLWRPPLAAGACPISTLA